MNREEILQVLMDIVRDVLDDETLVLTEDTLREETPEWDSVAHMTIMALAESEFGIELEVDEMVAAGRVKEIIELILSKKGA